jgi:RNA polymerase sigma factor
VQQSDLARLIFQATNGVDTAREQLIRHYKPYIINTIGHITGRYITWSDEEASIGLLAFNRAIDTFEVEGGRTFLNYVYLLIKRDLIDYFRKEKKEVLQSLDVTGEDKEFSTSLVETQKSMESYHRSLQSKDLVEEILELSEILNQYDILFENLEKYSPKHQDTRKNLLEMAEQFLQQPELVEELKRKRRFPIKDFIHKTGYHPKTIERYRKYLVTLIIVGLHPEWRHLSEYIPIPTGSEKV